MRNLLAYLCIMLAMLFACSGCSTRAKPFLMNRLQDSVDMVTVVGGLGAGAKAKAGPLHFGWFYDVDCYGVRGSARYTGIAERWDIDNFVFPFGQILPGPILSRRQPPFGLDAFSCRTCTHAVSAYWVPFYSLPEPIANPATGVRVPGNVRSFYTQIEVAAGAGGTIRLGCNPGEMADFVLGWFGYDIYGDDVAGKKGSDIAAQQKLAAKCEP